MILKTNCIKREERQNFDVAEATRKALTSARAEDVQERPIDLTVLDDAADVRAVLFI